MAVPDLSKSYTLEPFTADSRHFEGAIRVYTHTWRRSWRESYSFFSRYAHYPDFYGVVALERGRVVGMGFGTRSEPGQWWHDKVAQHVGTDHPALQDAWVLIELAVVGAYRNRAIGGALHDALLSRQPCARALLSTEAGNAGARRFYERRGWYTLHHGVVFQPATAPFVIMGNRVGTR